MSVDNISKEERSHVMSLVKQKNTKPEMIVRSFLHRNGLRYTLHNRSLPGKPDLVFLKYKTIVFVNGCFWHGHKAASCKLARIPKSNVEFWVNKIATNSRNDAKNFKLLKKLGWQILIIWECQLSREANLVKLLGMIRKNSNFMAQPDK